LSHGANQIRITAIELIGASEGIIGFTEAAGADFELAQLRPVIRNVVLGADKGEERLARAGGSFAAAAA